MSSSRDGAVRTPGDDRDAALRWLYEDVLGVVGVGAEDGFFVLGGSSLLVEVLLERVVAEFGVTVPVEDFYAEPTLAGLQTLVFPATGGDPGRGEPAAEADLLALLTEAAGDDPARAAVTGPDGTLSYADVLAVVAEARDAAGDRPGPRVVRLPTTAAGARTALAALAGPEPVLLLDPAATAAEEQQAWTALTGELAEGRRLPMAVHAVTTSGSTGRAKVVLTPNDGTVRLRLSQARDLGVHPGDRYLVTAPLHFGYGLGAGLLTGLLGGATVLLPPQPLTPEGLRTWAEQHAITLLMGVGLPYRFLLAAGASLPSLRLAMVGGEPLVPALADAWRERTGVPLADAYGTSETGHVSTNVDGVPGSVGRALPGVELRVLPAGGAAQPTGTGELLVRSPALALGYAGDPELTADRFRDGWYHTGDLAEVRSDGQLFLRGRLDDQLNVGGAKVDPREVEAACRAGLELRDCAVVGQPLPSGRTEICAYVVADRPVSRADLVQALGGRLSSHKIPTRVVQLDALPRGSNGKLARQELPR
ncbi:MULTISPECIES: class I adenylate-forming enzyme family protein [unclassified Modestobacter]|uniref:class I adenylate-forming enzyme family protein n=1 Tax=unclassified Modestobacter TaxID=2643866 RepID=UPI0022AA899D|nr:MULTISPECIES: AMP-binding protein [unclassified Modestobacter]MCZ2825747.1 AMP-binding protein [Modestobacter sp. VKM Ac-2981]MCZ2853188.1 AMP-binding protein [Modestobacter sp. VKM Ac-2982]